MRMCTCTCACQAHVCKVHHMYTQTLRSKDLKSGKVRCGEKDATGIAAASTQRRGRSRTLRLVSSDVSDELAANRGGRVVFSVHARGALKYCLKYSLYFIHIS